MTQLDSDSYQSKKPYIEAVGICLKVKSTKIPEELFECGRLEISFGEKDTNKCDVQMKLTSSSCDEQIHWILDESWMVNNQIQLCLINTDKSWKTTTYQKCLKMTVGIIQSVPFKVRFTDSTQEKIKDEFTGIKHEKTTDEVIEFDVTMSKRKEDLDLCETTRVCSEECDFVERRKQIICTEMRKNSQMFENIESKNVPNIAIIGSGGGIRAVIGMSAAMTVLQEKHILEYAMYTAGLSGSAWYLLTLYAQQNFDPHTVMFNIRQNLDDFKGRKRVIALTLLKYYGKCMIRWIWPTVTDIFGQMIFNLLRDADEKEKEVYWSETASKLQAGNIPCPLIAALQVIEHKTNQEHNYWVEFSPYQVFIPHFGTGINMKHFGREFYGGFCTGKFKEKPIEFLHGMCGSAYAIGRDLMPSENTNIMSIRCIKWCKRFLWSLFDYVCVAKVPNILFGIRKVTENQHDNQEDPRVEGFSLWTFWNFIFRKDQRFKNTACHWKEMMLVDAGIAFNSPYPTILRPSRNIDLIISFDFSRRDDDKKSPFKALLQAEEWARNKKVEFPNIRDRIDDIERNRGQNHYDEVYTFQKENAPTIMHFVLVNNSYRNNDDFDIFPDYDTLRFNYTTEEFNRLYYLVRYNVSGKVDTINQNIKKAITKREVISNKKKEEDKYQKRRLQLCSSS